jgi:hypothetical protein
LNRTKEAKVVPPKAAACNYLKNDSKQKDIFQGEKYLFQMSVLQRKDWCNVAEWPERSGHFTTRHLVKSSNPPSVRAEKGGQITRMAENAAQ